jgi:threonine dehydrogenase-like Zn-dependent dehydrogenase
LSADLLKMGQGSLVMAGYHHSPGTYNLRNFAYKGLVAHQAHPHYSPDESADYKRALAALGKGVFPMEKLITHKFGLDEVGTGFNALRSHQADFIKGIVVPSA